MNFRKNISFTFAACSGGKSVATYSVEVAGSYSCDVYVASGNGIGANPITIQTYPTVLDHSKAIAWGRSLVMSFSDFTSIITVAAHDYLGNPRTAGRRTYPLTPAQVNNSLAFQVSAFCPMPCVCGDPYFALLGTSFASSSPDSKIDVADNSDGTFDVKIMFQSIGNHSVHIFNSPCGSQAQTPISGSPFVIPAQNPLWEVTLSDQMSSPSVNQYGVVSVRFRNSEGVYVTDWYIESPQLLLKGLDKQESDACKMYYNCEALVQTIPDSQMETSECRNGQRFGIFKTMSAGSYAVSAVFPPSNTGRSANIKNSPLQVAVKVAGIDVPSFTATLGDLNGRSSNTVITFVIHSRDTFSNLVSLNRCGDVVDVAATATADGSLLSIFSAATAVPIKQLMTMMTSSAL